MTAPDRNAPDRNASKRNDFAPRGICRCEATIAPGILEGYACGRADCWRTAEARALFEAFVETLVAARGDEREPKQET